MPQILELMQPGNQLRASAAHQVLGRDLAGLDVAALPVLHHLCEAEWPGSEVVLEGILAQQHFAPGGLHDDHRRRRRRRLRLRPWLAPLGGARRARRWQCARGPPRHGRGAGGALRRRRRSMCFRRGPLRSRGRAAVPGLQWSRARLRRGGHGGCWDDVRGKQAFDGGGGGGGSDGGIGGGEGGRPDVALGARSGAGAGLGGYHRVCRSFFSRR
mmetsp:Transcript_122183/g.390808  ORF Transcript_122183/g.390808 Transcript_122183/m.390808 type:complete len:214 (-) Transcript_122183:1013-1654(-)